MGIYFCRVLKFQHVFGMPVNPDIFWCEQTTTYTDYVVMTLVKSAQKFNFRISHPKHMLWVLKRTLSMRQFF